MPYEEELQVKVKVEDSDLDSGLAETDSKIKGFAERANQGTKQAVKSAGDGIEKVFHGVRKTFLGLHHVIATGLGIFGLVVSAVLLIKKAIDEHRQSQEELNKSTRENIKTHEELITAYDEARKAGIKLTQAQEFAASAAKAMTASDFATLVGIQTEKVNKLQAEITNLGEVLRGNATDWKGLFRVSDGQNERDKTLIEQMQKKSLELEIEKGQLESLKNGHIDLTTAIKKEIETKKDQDANEARAAKNRKRENEMYKRVLADNKHHVDELAQAEKARLQVAKETAGAIGTAFESATQAAIESGKAGEEAWKGFAQSMLQTLVGMLGQELIQKGAAAISEGLAALLNPLTAIAAPGYFAQGAALSAAGGAIKAAAPSIALAEGGIVTEPTVALVGEAGPEAVIPLSDSGAGFMGGLSIDKISMNFPGVRNQSDLKGARFAETAARQLATTIQRLNERRGS